MLYVSKFLRDFFCVFTESLVDFILQPFSASEGSVVQWLQMVLSVPHQTELPEHSAPFDPCVLNSLFCHSTNCLIIAQLLILLVSLER